MSGGPSPPDEALQCLVVQTRDLEESSPYETETERRVARQVRLAARIAVLIEKRGLTQAEAADALGIDQPSVSDLVRAASRLLL